MGACLLNNYISVGSLRPELAISLSELGYFAVGEAARLDYSLDRGDRERRTVMIRHILLATDGSRAAERAADFAATLALKFGAELTVLYAEGSPPRRLQTDGTLLAVPDGPESVQLFLSRLADRLRGLGIAGVDTTVVEGPAVNVIVGVAESRRPDVLVLGARGWGTWQGPGLGSVSMAVLQRAECPVMVVK